MDDVNVRETVEFEYENQEYRLHGLSGEFVFERIRSAGTFYELNLLEKIAELGPNQSGLAVDVGANIGNHTVFFAKHLGLRVLSIEPEALNVNLLRENIEANGLLDPVEVLPVAAMAKAGTVALEQRIDGNRGTFSAHASDTGVASMALDELVGDEDVALIKIDVEGAELEVLLGAERILRSQKPLVVVEAHGSADRAAMNHFFASREYAPVAIAGISDNYFWMPTAGADNATEAAWNQSVLENQRIEYRLARDILAEVAAARKQLLSLSEKGGATPESQGMLTPQILASMLSLLSTVHGLVERQQPGSGSRTNATPELMGEIQRLERLRRSLSEDNASQEGLIRQYTRDLNKNIDELRAMVRGLSEDVNKSASAGLDDVKRELSGIRTADILDRVDGLEDPIAELREEVSSIDGKLGELVSLLDPKNEADDEPPIKEIEETLVPGPEDSTAIAKFLPEQEPIEMSTPEAGRSRLAQSDVERLIRAYAHLALRLERSEPRVWSATAMIDGMSRQLGLSTDELQSVGVDRSQPSELLEEPNFVQSRIREIHLVSDGKSPSRDAVRIGIASMAGREAGLARVLGILSPQADEIFVYLNGMDKVPTSLPRRSNVRFFTGPDVGDRGKFAFMEGFEGYYITCDDDIEYAPFHVHSIIDGIERYERKAVVGWHGSNFKKEFSKFYDSNSRDVLSFRFLRGRDTPVHLLGTGVCGFHTQTIDVCFEDFTKPNMADVFLAIAAKHQKVPMMVLAHGKGWAKPIEVGPSISTVSLKKDVAPKGDLDVGAIVSQLVLENKPWNAIPATSSYDRTPFSVAFIGRTDKSRWKKGGILKSAHLTVDHLRRFGVEVLHEDIVTGDPKGLGGRRAEIIMLYVGDPERPDFKQIESLVGHHAAMGRKVIVNLSFNGKATRTSFILKKMEEWKLSFGSNVLLMVFTEAILELSSLAAIRDRIVVVPKTLVYPDQPVASFSRSEGVFVGDIAKLSDSYLLDFPAAEWISAIRSSLPGVKLYGVRQYKPKYQVDLDIDQVWPFLSPDDIVERIGSRRLMISMVKYATFEMVPVEAAALGVPVVYPGMPQSLSEYLGIGGLRIDSPTQLSRILPELYYDPIVWRSFSEAGALRGKSAELNNTAGQLYVRMLDVLRG